MKRVLIITLIVFAFTFPVFAYMVELPPTADATVYESQPSSNYGYLDYINWGQSTEDMWGFIVFDGLSGYMGVSVDTAILSVFMYSSNDFYDNFLRRVTEDWEENDITWNNKPDTTTEGQLNLLTPQNQYVWFDIDVAAFVQDWVDDTYPNYGFCFLRTDNLNNIWRFRSKEYGDPDFRPLLTMEFTSPVESTSLGTVKAAFK